MWLRHQLRHFARFDHADLLAVYTLHPHLVRHRPFHLRRDAPRPTVYSLQWMPSSERCYVDGYSLLLQFFELLLHLRE